MPLKPPSRWSDGPISRGREGLGVWSKLGVPGACSGRNMPSDPSNRVRDSRTSKQSRGLSLGAPILRLLDQDLTLFLTINSSDEIDLRWRCIGIERPRCRPASILGDGRSANGRYQARL